MAANHADSTSQRNAGRGEVGLVELSGWLIDEARTCTITASQAGNDYYLAATNLLRPFEIGKSPQSLTFDAIEPKTFGDAHGMLEEV
jgi:hypothetical protein